MIMTNEDKNILWLYLFEFLSYGKKIKLLNALPKQDNLRENFLKMSEIKQILTNEEFNKMSLCLSETYLINYLIKYQQDEIETVTFNNPNYPYILKETSNPPLCLYCKGDVSLLSTQCLAVVGTRMPTEYGIQVTKQYCKEIAKAGLTIVSGMASGVDAIAHKTAIEHGGKTIAVLAGGFDYIYPPSNLALARELMKNHLIITEHPPFVKAEGYFFPVRNRIIAGLSKGVFVPEMGEKSGTLHTINYALDYNRDIFAVPGKINSPMSKGTNNLIKRLQGAITTAPEDILFAYNLVGAPKEKTTQQIDLNSQMILSFIETEKHTYQEILEHSKMSANELNILLSTLELEGMLIKLANNSYIMA